MKCSNCDISTTSGHVHANVTDDGQIVNRVLCGRCETYRNDPSGHPGNCPTCGQNHATDDYEAYDRGYECFRTAKLFGGKMWKQYKVYHEQMKRYCDAQMRERMEGPLPTRCPSCFKEHRRDDMYSLDKCSEKIKASDHKGCNPARGLCHSIEFARYLCYLQGMTTDEANQHIALAIHAMRAEREILKALLSAIIGYGE